MHRRLFSSICRLFCLVSLLLPASPHVQASEPPHDPIEHWELDFDTGVLWDVGGRGSTLDYTFLPQILTPKTGAMTRRAWGGGDLVVRSRFSLLAEPIVRGRESHFVGLVVAPSIEWWNSARKLSTFFSIGGGVGWMDSRGYQTAGAQGQDLNLTWFIHGGVRYRFTDRLSAALGLYFQHISNGGQDQVNPGSDALGPTLGIGWHF